MYIIDVYFVHNIYGKEIHQKVGGVKQMLKQRL